MIKPNHLLVYVLYGDLTEKYHGNLLATLEGLTEFNQITPLVLCDVNAGNFLSNNGYHKYEIFNDVRNYFRFSKLSERLGNMVFDSVSFRDADSAFNKIDCLLLDTFTDAKDADILAIRDSRYHVWPLMGGLNTLSWKAFELLNHDLQKYDVGTDWYADQRYLAEFYGRHSNTLNVLQWGRGYRYFGEKYLIKNKKIKQQIYDRYFGFWGMPIIPDVQNPPAYDFSGVTLPSYLTRNQRYQLILKINLIFNKVRRKLTFAWPI